MEQTTKKKTSRRSYRVALKGRNASGGYGLLGIVVAIVFFVLWVLPVAGEQSEYQKWLKGQTAAYQEYRDERDREFESFLKKEWQAFQMQQGVRQFKKPKPVRLPVAVPDPTPLGEPSDTKPAVTLPVVKKFVPPPPAPPLKIVEPPAREPLDPIEPGHKPATFTFYGRTITIHYDPALHIPEHKRGAPIKAAIARFWSLASRSDPGPLVSQLNWHRKQMRLNDWGYHHLLANFASAVYGPGDSNGARLLTWFVLNKSGYEARIGYNHEALFSMVPVAQKLYGVTYLTIKGRRYYNVGFEKNARRAGSLFTYPGRYPGADRVMDYRIPQSPMLSRDERRRTLSFTFGKEQHRLNVAYDARLAAFFERYPQTDFGLYFDGALNSPAGQAVGAELSKILAGRTLEEAVTLLLHMTQRTFEYKTDDRQFGREKYMLPEETLFYPFSDCEDRSIFFAGLVKRLLKLDVVGLHYPNHLATAVALGGNRSGATVTYRGQTYWVCDPTYVNAGIGQVMPAFKNVIPRVIPIGG